MTLNSGLAVSPRPTCTHKYTPCVYHERGMHLCVATDLFCVYVWICLLFLPLFFCLTPDCWCVTRMLLFFFPPFIHRCELECLKVTGLFLRQSRDLTASPSWFNSAQKHFVLTQQHLCHHFLFFSLQNSERQQNSPFYVPFKSFLTCKKLFVPASQMCGFAAFPLNYSNSSNFFLIILNIVLLGGQNKHLTLGSGYLWRHFSLFSEFLQSVNRENNQRMNP